MDRDSLHQVAQLDRDCGLDAVANLDFTRVNPVTGPVLAVDILELRPRDWGWMAWREGGEGLAKREGLSTETRPQAEAVT